MLSLGEPLKHFLSMRPSDLHLDFVGVLVVWQELSSAVHVCLTPFRV
jgi:hypothetical protein